MDIRIGLAAIAMMSLVVCAAHARDLGVTVSSNQSTIVQNEPLMLAITFVNSGDDPVEVSIHPFGRYETGEIEVGRPDGASVSLRRPNDDYVNILVSKTTRTLAANESDEVSFALCCEPSDESGSVFDQVGDYTIAVRYRYRNVSAESDPITIEVVAPPESEEVALRHLRRLEHPITYYRPELIGTFRHREGEAVIEALERIAGVEDSTLYANHARFSLASFHVMQSYAANEQPHLYDFDEHAEAAEAMLDAIDMDEFAFADRAKQLRSDLEAVRKRREERDDS